MSGNRNKKNGKKSKFLNFPEVLQVKSVKLDTNKAKEDKNGAKSEDNLRKCHKSNIMKNSSNNEDEPNEGVEELETSIMQRYKTLSLNSEGENSVPCSSLREPENPASKTTDGKATEDDISLMMEYCPELGEEPNEQCSYYTHRYYPKHSKSIKFTNQVTVLYFNGEDILCESMEPLKKELDQQIRNKEMRKEHLMSKGQIDNLYLF